MKSFKRTADAFEYVNVRLLHSNRRHVSATSSHPQASGVHKIETKMQFQP